MNGRLPIKRIADVTLGKMVQPDAKSELDVSAPYLRAAHIQPNGQILDLPEQPMWFSRAELRQLDLCVGDVVVVEGGAGYGRSAVLRAGLGGWGFQNSIIRLRPRQGLGDGRFIDYALQSALASGAVDAVTSTATIPHFTAEKVGGFEIPAPDVEKQRRIADYLDAETDQIGAFIAEQQRFIELLQDRKLGLIASSTLQGVDPLHVPAAPPVPFAALGRGFTVTLGKMLDAGKAAREHDRVLPYIRAANVQRSGLDLSDANSMPFSAEEARALDLRASDVLVIEGGATVGVCLVLDRDMPGWSFQKTVNRLRPTSNWDSRFYAYVLMVYRKVGIIDVICNKSTIPHLTAEKLRAMVVPVPRPDEQRAIADWLDNQMARINALVTEAERNIALSKERRAAVITAAVTGLIDVSTERAA